METIRKINETIGLDIYMNCVLVRAGIRNAMLIQPADYNEAVNTDPITTSKLKALKKAFPELIQSSINGETIISLKLYKEGDIQTNEEMGTILGFPCAAEFEYTLNHPDEPKTGISIIVKLIPGSNDEHVEIIAYMCRDDKTYVNALELAQKAQTILKSDPIIGKIVENVIVMKRLYMPPKYLINKLLNNTISEEDHSQIINYIWNLNLENADKYQYDFKNPVHRGILIGLLSMYDNNRLQPFFPLQHRPEYIETIEISIKWDSALKDIFSSPTKGGYRKTRKQAKYYI